MENIDTLIEQINTKVESYESGIDVNAHPYEISELLLSIRSIDEQRYVKELAILPEELKALILIELPKHCHEELIEHFTPHELAELTSNLDTDDAAELIRNIDEIDGDVATQLMDELPKEDRKTLQKLIDYGEYEAGSYMQTELFKATVDENIGESVKRLKKLKAEKELDNVYQVYIVDQKGLFLASIPLEDLILLGPSQPYASLIQEGVNKVTVNATSDINSVVEIASNYDMNVVPVVDDKGKLLGRITSDDIYDIIEERATGQIYGLAGVNDEAEQVESLFQIGRSRAFWLGINLLTAILASIVIGLFDTTLNSLVALAILMPIVASMGGNAGTQTLTVTVRQMALGEIDNSDAKKTIKKEVYLALMNGFLFAVVIGLIAWKWFNLPMLGIVIAFAMIINLFTAGLFGSLIPLLLKKADIDPAVGSSVLLTTVTDIVGFFSFLGLAAILL